MSEHSQRASDAFNLYNAYANEAESAYAREYQAWADSVEQAWKMIGMQNQDYWAQTEFDEGVRQYNQNFAEDQRRYEQDFAEDQRQYNESMAFNKEQAALDEAYRWATFDEQKKQNEADNKYRDRAMSQSVYEFAVTHGDKDGNGVLTPDEIAEYNAVEAKGGEVDNSLGLTNSEYDKFFEVYDTKGEDAAFDYLDAIGKSPTSDTAVDAVASMITNHSAYKQREAEKPIDWANVEITKTKETKNGGGGIDNNDEFRVNGEIYTAAELKAVLEKEDWSDKKINSLLNSISDIEQNETYSFNGGLKKK
jgi:hypothetical protein